MANAVQKSEPAGLLSDKLCLVTGSSRGIGAAIAEAFAEQGGKIILTAEPAQQENLDKVAESCRAKGAPHVDIIAADYDQTEQVDELAKKILEKYGCVDVLVHCAGEYGPMSLEKGPNKGQGPLDGDPAEWDRTTRINMLGPMHLTRWLAPPMVEKGDGYIITIASIEALSPYPSAPAYSSTKWGLRGWTKACYAALKTQNVKVTTINPAQVDTSMTADRPDQTMIPELEITPQDIAETCLIPFRLSKNVVIEELIVHTAKTPKEPKK